MKKSPFSDEQMVTILRGAGKAPVAEVAKKHGISEQTNYTRRQHFDGLEAADVKRLEQENAWSEPRTPTARSRQTGARGIPHAASVWAA